MIRNSSISTFLALIIISAMTLADTRTLVFELDEIIEGREIENEELKEGSEIEREWLKLLASGGPDFLPSGFFLIKSSILCLNANRIADHQAVSLTSGLPLFILHCSLKIHLG